jgi:hypothetical protein
LIFFLKEFFMIMKKQFIGLWAVVLAVVFLFAGCDAIAKLLLGGDEEPVGEKPEGEESVDEGSGGVVSADNPAHLTLYVRANGDDGNSGLTEAEPFLTVGAALAAVSVAYADLDDLWPKGGTAAIVILGVVPMNTTATIGSAHPPIVLRGASPATLQYTGAGDLNTGVLNIESGGVVTLSGDLTLDGNHVTNMRGVFVKSGGTFTMTGGIITSCNIGNSIGAGVRMAGGEFTMTGGTIYDNTTSQHGGGVAMIGGTFRMEGGEISNNESSNGGGVNLFNSAASMFTMAGNAVISGNTAVRGGGVYYASGTFSKTGNSVIYGDGSNTATAKGNGNAVYASKMRETTVGAGVDLHYPLLGDETDSNWNE